MPPRWRSLSAPTRPRRWPRERAAAADRGAAPEALKQIKTEDVVLQTVATLVNLAGQKLSVEGGRTRRRRTRRSTRPSRCCRWCRRRRSARSRTRSTRSRCSTPGRARRRRARRRPSRHRSRRSGRPAHDRRLRGLRLLQVPRRHDRGAGGHAVRASVGAGAGRNDRGHGGRLHAPARGRAHPAASPHQLPGEHLGDEEVGVRRIIGPSACGSLKPELEPGTFVLCDQFVDRTAARESTFYDGPQTTHVSAADPYCPDLRETLAEAAREEGLPVVEGGTVVVIEGPRFSTRAESRWYTDSGFDVVNMTQYPECWLARELELCYANISLDYRLRRGAPGQARRTSRCPRTWRSARSPRTSIDCARSCSGRCRKSARSRTTLRDGARQRNCSPLAGTSRDDSSESRRRTYPWNS